MKKTSADNIESFAQISCEEVYPHENLTLEIQPEDSHLEADYEERTEQD